MDIQQLLGYFGALLIGLVLGLIGGGGSILTVPILVYLLFLNPVTATAYSLFVVGVSALVGAIRNIQKGLVDFRTAIVFAIPAFIAVYITRKFIVPAIPGELFSVGSLIITKDIINIASVIIDTLPVEKIVVFHYPQRNAVQLSMVNKTAVVVLVIQIEREGIGFH